MKNVLCVYKPLGLSPLQTIHLLQRKYPEYTNSRIGYAGRLDPMAEGLLLLLLNEENKKKKTYEEFPKAYEFEVLFGVATDTYDTLGVITAVDHGKKFFPVELGTDIMNLLPSFMGKKLQSYPPYSSRTVHGKQLYWYAREGKLNEITIPTKEIEITSLALLSSTLLSSKEFEQSIDNRIQLVSGAFRQEEIRSSWQSLFNHSPLPHFPLYRFHIQCSSGTYVRAIANAIGEKVGIPSLAYSIKRTAIGPYTLSDALQLEPIA